MHEGVPQQILVQHIVLLGVIKKGYIGRDRNKHSIFSMSKKISFAEVYIQGSGSTLKQSDYFPATIPDIDIAILWSKLENCAGRVRVQLKNGVVQNGKWGHMMPTHGHQTGFFHMLLTYDDQALRAFADSNGDSKEAAWCLRTLKTAGVCGFCEKRADVWHWNKTSFSEQISACENCLLCAEFREKLEAYEKAGAEFYSKRK